MTPADHLIKHGRHRLRVLAITSHPWTEDRPLNLRGEWHALQSAAQTAVIPMTLTRLLPATLPELERTMGATVRAGQPPHVVHFSGHGTVDLLAFEDRLGRKASAQWEAVHRAMAPWGDTLETRVQVVVLNACYTTTARSKGFAERLVEQGIVRAAIGYRQPVADAAAVQFAKAFYTRLALGETVGRAFIAGRKALRVDWPHAADAIVLEGDGHFALRVQSTVREARVYDGLPPVCRLPEPGWFFGRGQAAVQVGAWLADPAVKAVAVAGVGGIGKSTLCRTVARRQGWRFRGGMVEVTARANLFGAPTARDLVIEAANALGFKGDDDRATVAALLAAPTPWLIHFDNLESLPVDELGHLLRLIEQIPLEGSKALLSLRPVPDVLEEWADLRVLSLTRGLGPQAAAGYAVKLAEQKDPPTAPLAGSAPGATGWQGLPLHLPSRPGDTRR